MVQPLEQSGISYTFITVHAIWDSRTVFALDIILTERICITHQREKP